jgi:hypothetical protein
VTRGAVRIFLAALPPLLVAGALSAAPKGKGKHPPAKPPREVGVESEPEAGTRDARELPTKTADARESGELVKESERKEGDAAVKVFEFGTTEIEGRARWPAVTYFVRRMRAEFDAQKLPHRPFLPELSATKGDPAVR